MTHSISEDRRVLTLHADLDEQYELQTLRLESPEEWGTWEAEHEALESMIANGELGWIDPAETGDLTEAPMLGIIGEEQREASGPFGVVMGGLDPDGPLWFPILERWAFMDYQLRSFLDDLADNGSASFTS